MKAQKELAGTKNLLRLGQFYYHDNEGWAMVAGIGENELAVFAIDQPEPSLFFHNKDYPPISSKRVLCDYSPYMIKNSARFKFGDYLYFVYEGEIKPAFMLFHCGDGKIQVEYNGSFVAVDSKYFFKIVFR